MFTSAGWKRQHGDKDMLSNWRSPPRPGAKSSEQGRPYNRRNREVGRRREGGGTATSRSGGLERRGASDRFDPSLRQAQSEAEDGKCRSIVHTYLHPNPSGAL